LKPSPEDKKIIRQIQGDLPISQTPFKLLAPKVGLSEKEFLRRVQSFIRRGWIRRFGAILRHQKAGYQGNAMVVWKVAENQIETVSQAMTAFSAVSHCYLRSPYPNWPFNLYTMVHGRNEEDCRRIARKISKETNLKNYRLLFSKREHKKSSMRYFEKQ
jgi:siroheme decarboxylase